MDGFHDSSRGYGGTGELVELAAVAFHPPAFFYGIGQRFAVKAQNPVGSVCFYTVSQSGCFTMLDDTYPGQCSVQVDSDEQPDIAVITLRRHRRQHSGYRPSALARAVHANRFIGPQQLGVMYQQGIGKNIVVITIGWYQLVKAFQ